MAANTRAVPGACSCGSAGAPPAAGAVGVSDGVSVCPGCSIPRPTPPYGTACRDALAHTGRIIEQAGAYGWGSRGDLRATVRARGSASRGPHQVVAELVLVQPEERGRKSHHPFVAIFPEVPDLARRDECASRADRLGNAVRHRRHDPPRDIVNFRRSKAVALQGGPEPMDIGEPRHAPAVTPVAIGTIE